MELVSACLVGKNCRYDGKNCYCEAVAKYVEKNRNQIILICPEQLGGLSTPRTACEINNNQVISKDGVNTTKAFKNGADQVLSIVKEYEITRAIMKSKSPSCGYQQIYDGTFSGKLVEGNGITTQVLINNQVPVVTEIDFENPDICKNNVKKLDMK